MTTPYPKAPTPPQQQLRLLRHPPLHAVSRRLHPPPSTARSVPKPAPPRTTASSVLRSTPYVSPRVDIDLTTDTPTTTSRYKLKDGV